jgi:peptidoglycan/xylan/chitin deacetylase (PgdA/CDA1 family)
MNTRTAFKGASVRALTAVGAARFARWVRRDSLVVLTYHNIVPRSEHARQGEASLHVDRATFAEQLDVLAETHEIVGLADVLNGVRWPSGRPRALITFDDAYQGAMTIGVDELLKRRMLATVFVAPAFTAGRTFWWDAIGAGHAGTIPDDIRRAALETYDGIDDRVREWAERNCVPLGDPGPTQRCATVRELRSAALSPGITFGAHSWSHPVMANLDPDELREELRRPLSWLYATLDNVVPALAVPYGLSSPWVEFEARRLGYAAMFTGRRGWVPPTAMVPFTLPRENVPAGMGRESFVLRSAGVLA